MCCIICVCCMCVCFVFKQQKHQLFIMRPDTGRHMPRRSLRSSPILRFSWSGSRTRSKMYMTRMLITACLVRNNGNMDATKSAVRWRSSLVPAPRPLLQRLAQRCCIGRHAVSPSGPTPFWKPLPRLPWHGMWMLRSTSTRTPHRLRSSPMPYMYPSKPRRMIWAAGCCPRRARPSAVVFLIAHNKHAK